MWRLALLPYTPGISAEPSRTLALPFRTCAGSSGSYISVRYITLISQAKSQFPSFPSDSFVPEKTQALSRSCRSYFFFFHLLVPGTVSAPALTVRRTTALGGHHHGTECHVWIHSAGRAGAVNQKTPVRHGRLP